jgi:hypothetical protein
MKRAGVEPGSSYTVDEHTGDGDDSVTRLTSDDGRQVEVEDRLARTVSVRVDERGDGPVSDLADAGPELQLLGQDRWGM